MNQEKTMPETNSGSTSDKKKGRLCRPCIIGGILILIILGWAVSAFIRWIF